MEIGKRSSQVKGAEMLLHKMVDELEDYAIIFLNLSGDIISWNPGAQKIKGYQQSEIIGKNFRIFYSADDQGAGVPEKVLAEARQNKKASYEGWRIRRDGSQFWGSITLTALHDEEANVIGYCKVTRDLTERKAAEDVIRSKNAALESINKELASFAYIASHDLQEPLRKIQTFISRIIDTEKDRLSEKSIDFFKRIESASQRMQTLIQDLLAYSRAGTDLRPMEAVDLNNVLLQVRSDIQESIEERKASIVASSLPVVQGIQFQLVQLFINLLSNSLKFSKPDEPLRIVISAEIISPANHPAVRQLPGKSYHHISVSDNGIGFEQEYHERIFGLFQRLHGRSEYSGTGLGLAICKKIVENHHGVIHAEGAPGVGATFHIYLPV